MNRKISRLLLVLMLLSVTHAHARGTFVISPSVSDASISNIKGFKNSSVARVDASYFILPEFGVGLFGASYTGFKSSGGGNEVGVKLSGFGPSVTGRWPVHPNVQPFVRLDYMLWDAESTALGRSIAKDKGGSAGLAVGVHFPIHKFIGAKAEVSGYNKVSGADIRQFSIGAVFEF